MSLSSVGIIPYRRLTDPLVLPYGTSSTRTAVPAGFIPPESTSFRVTNRGSSWVRLKGAQGSAAATLSIADGEGWLFPPGFSGTFTTQFPEAMATIAVGAGASNGVLEITYGIGGSGESVAQLISSGGSTGGNVVVTNTPLPVSVTNLPATQPVSGSVSVSNLPATQPVSGSVSVSNFPATQTTVSRGTGSMATGQVAMSAGNTAYLVAAARANRRSITLVPTSQFTYYYGNAGVTQTTGAAAPNGAAITLETTAAVYVVSGSTGTMTFVEHF